ncbi:9481_t:CDS:1 [Acaulospora morrowiae]|uniref:9481_t:CDS:1 n=1 Tax=Acaulospora morrowiae TaxID=94023 RepID=A0A9N8VWC4_9GLOM|nr:9481_t:CDS:1 [Acaulospora morrowiae]
MPSRDNTRSSSTVNINNNEDNTMSPTMTESYNLTMWPKKTHGTQRPLTIYSKNIIIPLSNDQEIISPIPSGHFETSRRFWQFKVEEGQTTYVRYGTIRADGGLEERATHIQQHPNYADAKKFVENLVDEKIKAGYVGWARW